MSNNRHAEKSLLGTVIDGKYRLDEELGSGGMGTVYLATQITVDRPVAIKLLHSYLTKDPSVRKRFEVEAKAIARLKHPNCVTLYEFGYSQELEALFTVVEYIKGRSLEHYVGRPLPWPAAISIMRQVASAVQHAHQHNIIHRDLKPDNIMVEIGEDEQQFVKILDFGIARIAEANSTDTRLTKIGQIFGTPPYMSPEQGRNNLEAGPGSDLYSMGIILFELITGELPFPGDSALEVLMKHVMDPVPPIDRSDVPEALTQIIYRLLEKEPSDRFPDCAALIKAFDAIEIPDDAPLALSAIFNPDDQTWQESTQSVPAVTPAYDASLDEDSEDVSQTERLPAGRIPSLRVNNTVDPDDHWESVGATTVRGGPPREGRQGRPGPAPHTPEPTTPAVQRPLMHTPEPTTPAVQRPLMHTPAPTAPTPTAPAPLFDPPSPTPVPTRTTTTSNAGPTPVPPTPGYHKKAPTELPLETTRSLSSTPMLVVAGAAVVVIILLLIVFLTGGDSTGEQPVISEEPVSVEVPALAADDDEEERDGLPDSPASEPREERPPSDELAHIEVDPVDPEPEPVEVTGAPVVDKKTAASENRLTGTTRQTAKTGTERKKTSGTSKTARDTEQVPRLRLDDVKQPESIRLDDVKKKPSEEERRPAPESIRLR